MPSRRLNLLAAAAAAAGTIAGCGSSSPSPPPSSSIAKPTPLTPPHRRPGAARGRHRPPDARTVGATLRVDAGGTRLDVTIGRLIDPLPDSGASLLPGTHAVGVLVRIRNAGPGVYDSSATGDVSVVPSSGAAPPVFAPGGTCQTELRDFDNYISAGEVRNGCVVFDVKNGARVKAVRFSPHADAAARVSWAVTR